MNNKFSENLKKIRKENNLSQEQLADELGVSRQAVSKWESAVAYPEMDKIITLCNKFNLNVDDLLHKDIKEVKGEEDSKKRINDFINDFLNFVTNAVNLFSNMDFKGKMKCLFEQSVISIILLICSLIVFAILNSLFGKILSFLPNNITSFIMGILGSIIIIALLCVSIMIITHIFKTRYLDYYEKSTKKVNIKDCSEENNNFSEKNSNKIIIRDAEHSEYKFINSLFKIIIIIIKIFLLWPAFLAAMTLIFLLFTFIASFMLYKTGIFFVGLLITNISSAMITIIVLLVILNFIFNRKSDKKRMIYTFIISLITFGIGCGLIFVGTLSFDISNSNMDYLKIETKEYDMKEDLIISPHNNYNIEYIEADNNNVKIEYSINKYCTIQDMDNEKNNIINPNYSCHNPIKIARETIKSINNKKVIPINIDIEKITVYTNKENIEILKNNYNNYQDSKRSDDEKLQFYQNRIDELEKENIELNQKLREINP